MALRNKLQGLFADLKANVLVDQQKIELVGNTAVGDQPVREYTYVADSTAIPDDVNVIDPTSGVGRYLLDTKPLTKAIALTTTGTGAATFTPLTGILNIPPPPTARRIETFLGSTDASGNYTVTYSSAFPSAPDVQPQLQAGTPSQIVRITSTTTTGFTVNVTNRASVTILGLEVLLAATTPVNAASVSVLVTAR